MYVYEIKILKYILDDVVNTNFNFFNDKCGNIYLDFEN